MKRIDAATVTAAAAAIFVIGVIVLATYHAAAARNAANAVVDALLDCAFFGEEGDRCEGDGRQ